MGKLFILLIGSLFSITAFADQQYTVINAKQYNQTVTASRVKISNLLEKLKSNPHLSVDSQIAFITHQLADIPYIYKNGMGEGDWQPTSTVYRGGALHLNQNPVYRLDTLNCQTFVQVVMALLYSNNLSQFDKNILKISYGAAGNPNGEIVHYYNRNNFIDADFNPVNQRNGLLTDVTSQGVLASYAKKTHATITRQRWFLKQEETLAETVQVLAAASGPSMVKRYQTLYSELPFPRFDSENVVVSYLPKNRLAIRKVNGSYKPNQALLDKIPTPAVLEIVRDVNRWNYYGTKVKDLIGSELTISHLGLIYRQKFKYGDLIYRKITCHVNNDDNKVCEVKPILCQKNSCNELMFAHATNAYPTHHYWYKTSDNNYVCSADKPADDAPYTKCNRVVSSPLFDYLTDYQLGAYWNMELRSVLGVHVERLG